MAAVDDGVEKGGYPREIFPNGFIDDKYLCNFCGLVLKEPVQSFCGHRFCKSCIDEHIRSGNQIKCTQCEKEAHDDEDDISLITEDQIFPDNAIKREMTRLDIRCGNHGCTWKGKFRNYEEHLTMCDFKMVTCRQCGQSVRKKDIEDHIATQCRLPCDLCGNQILVKDMKVHSESQCPKQPLLCDMCGREGILRGEFQQHRESAECQAGEIQCPVGCGLIPRKEFHDHFNKKKHSVWLMQRVDELSRSVNESSNSARVQVLEQRFSEEITNLRGEVSRMAVASNQGAANVSPSEIGELIRRQTESQLAAMNDRMNVKTGTFEGIASALHREMEKAITAITKLEQLRKDDSAKIDQLTSKVRALERTVAMKEIAMTELELRTQSMETVSYDGTFLWRVSDFSKKQQDAINGRTISLYSPPFYSSHRGYKMCARLYPNGDGMGKGSHLSLFFVVMRGNYDALLTWPFTRRVTFCLINQNGGEHVVDSFRPDPQSSSFKRPTSDMNIASGCPLFIRLEMLMNPNNGFLKDDTIFIKVAMDTTDLKDPISSFDDRVKPQI